jgi:transcription-repair coupling factor (superfamily II helicase)
MLNEIKIPQDYKGNIKIDNASRDFLEFLLIKIHNGIKRPLVFINQGLSRERIMKNFTFLNPNLKVKFVEEAEELYSLKMPSFIDMAVQNKAISEVLTEEFDVLCLDYRMLIKKLPPRDFFLENINLKQGVKFGYSGLINLLYNFGFLRCETVFDFAEFAVRGYIIDVGTLDGFFRIEFDGDIVTAITKFNTETQRKLPEVSVSELSIGKIKQIVLEQNWEDTVKKNAFKCEVYEVGEVIKYISNFKGSGLCAFLPLFYQQTASILDFLPKTTVFVKWINLDQTLEFYRSNLQDLHKLYIKDSKPFLAPNQLVLQKDDVMPKMELCVELSKVYSGL